MKANIILLSLFLSASPAPATDWEWVCSQAVGSAIGESSVGYDTSVWAIAKHGEMIRSTDGGRTFQRVPSRRITEFVDMAAWSKHVAAVADIEGLVFRTTDGGNVWTQVQLPTGDSAITICYTKNQTLWVSGSKGRILEFRTLIDTPTVHSLNVKTPWSQDLLARNDDVVWSTYDGIWRWSDAMGRWDFLTPQRLDYAFVIPDSNTIIGTLYVGGLSVSLNDGSARSIAADTGCRNLTTIDYKHIIVIPDSPLSNKISVSDDSGRTWKYVTLSLHVITELEWIIDSTIVAFTDNGQHFISTDYGQTWSSPQGVVPKFSFSQLIGDSVLLSATDYVNKIFRSDDFGHTWREIARVPLTRTITEIEFISELEWTVDAGGHMASTIDGGVNWLPLPNAGYPTTEIHRYFYTRVSEDTLYNTRLNANRDSTLVYRSTNNGVDWSILCSVNNARTGDLQHSSFGKNGGIALRCDYDLSILSRDAGASWDTVDMGFYAIHATSNMLFWGYGTCQRFLDTLCS